MSISSLFDLSNQTALVIGASSGLGKRSAEVLSEAGARVILASRKLTQLEQIASTLKDARAIQMDVTDKASVKTAFETLESDGEKINIVLFATGIPGRTPIFDIEQSSDFFEKEIQTNLVGLWYALQYAAKHMKDRNIKGSIIPIASISGGVRLRAGTAAYGTSKAGVIQLTRILTEELAEANIRINCISPGLFHTPMTGYKLDAPELKQKIGNAIPVKFVAEPSDLDGAVLYLASNRASRYVTGSCLTIDGGDSWVRYEQVKVPHPSELAKQKSKES